MSNSLVIAGQVELLGGKGGVASANPRCLGAVFQLLPGQEYSSSLSVGTYDLSAPQPTTDFVASLLTDGERPQGFRASNRTITLPIRITAPSFAVLAGAREVLLELVDQQFWPLTWTRDQGAELQTYPLVFDCFRALPTVVVWGGPEGLDLHPMGIMTLQFSALPYGRSDTQTQMAFAAPVPASPPAPPAPVVLDAFATINSAQCQQSTVCVIGPNSCFFDPGNSPANDPDGAQTPLVYGQQFTSPLNLSQMTALQMWLGLASRNFWHLHGEQGRARISMFFTLTDTNGNTLSFSRSNLRLPVSDTPGFPKFSRVTVGIPQGNTVFSYANVVAYSLVIKNQSTPDALRHLVAYLDALTAYSFTTTVSNVIRSSTCWLYGVKGTARSPVSLSFQAGPSAGTPTTLTTPGAGFYTVPAGTLYLSVAAWAPGGAGASQTTSGFGGGGGGGEYAQETVFAAAVGELIPYSVGPGGVPGATPIDGTATVFGPGTQSSLQVVANPGHSVAQNSITGGPGGSGSANTVHFSGGTGRTATGSVGGGGGGGAGTATPGLSPMGTAATVFISGSGNWTCPPGVTTVFAECWGGGAGAGAGQFPGAGFNGSGGGGGEYAAQQVNVTPGNNYAWVAGAGGAGGSGSGGGGQSGTNGSNSTFAADGGVTVTAHGATAGTGLGDGSGRGGGSGSTNTVHFQGGRGGGSYPYTGGGGSSAGPAAGGNAGGTPGGATGPSGGGGGGSGSGAQNGAGHNGSAPGGGGGGAHASGFAAGNGASGQVRLTYPSGLGAPTNVGALAVPGGGAGGAGGPSPNTGGSAGSAPGGGGGGADSSGTSETGGLGGNGKLVITPFQSLPFKTLVVHRPKYGCHPNYWPIVSVGNGGDVPDGTHFYTIPQPQAGINAQFDGTYTIVLVASAFNSPTVNRTITVTVTQTEYTGGPSYSQSTQPVIVAPGLASTTGPGNQVNNGVLIAGVLTLPVKALAYDNTTAFFQVSVTDTNTSDRFYDVLLLDTMGQTLIINEPSTGYISYYADEPDPIHDLGLYLGSQSGRAGAVSVADAIQAVSGGPFTVEPKECLLFAYSADASAPSIGLSYYDRYFFDHIAT